MYNYESANNLINNAILKEQGYNIFIPYNYALCKGIVRFIDITISETELINCTNSPCSIVEVRRLNRRIVNPDKSIKYEPTGTVLYTFEGTLLPRFVSIYGLTSPVATYIPPVTQCFSCLQYGHTRLQCKSKKKCFNCGSYHEPEAEQSGDCLMQCWHCESPLHRSSDKRCPEYVRQKAIKYLMATENLTFFDANNLCPKNFTTSRDKKNNINNEFNYHTTDFPTLQNKKAPVEKDTISISQRSSTATSNNQKTKRSYTQTLMESPKKRHILQNTQGYDKEAHNSQLYFPNSRPINFPNSYTQNTQPTSAFQKNLLSDFNKHLPDMDTNIIDEISKSINTFRTLKKINQDYDKPKKINSQHNQDFYPNFPPDNSQNN